MSDEIVRADGTVVRGYRGRAFFYDRQGQPINAEEADPLLADDEYRRVARDVVILDGQELVVSTVWLAANFNPGGDRPMIFETMIFGTHPLAGAMWRNATEDEALAAHQLAITALRTARLTDEALEQDGRKEITP